MSAKISGTMEDTIDCKRFYMPGVKITAKCPQCGTDVVKDLSSQYLGYPPTGKPFAHGMYHGDGKCEAEWKITLRLDVVLSVVE